MALATMSESVGRDAEDVHSIGPISLSATTVAEFGRWLEDVLGRHVIDETGLAGLYDIDVPGEMHGIDELRQAIQAHLALALTRTERDAQMLVVRRAIR